MKLAKLLKDIERAEAAYLKELKRQYPIGKTVTYRLRGGPGAHRYPWQEGRVVGYAADGRRLRVELAASRSSVQIGHDHRYINSLPLTKIKGAL